MSKHSTQDATAPVMTIEEFCESHRISRGFLNVLKQRGEAPDFIKIGRRVLISSEAAQAWRNRHTVRAAGVLRAEGGRHV